MKKSIILLLNGILIFIAALFRITYENGSLNITALSVVFAAVGAGIGVLILIGLNTFVTKKDLPAEYHQHKDKLHAVKITQVALVIALILMMNLKLNPIILFAPVVLLFAIPGYIAIKYNVLYSGMIVFGGTYITGEKAKAKGIALAVFAGILLLAIVALGVMSPTFT